MLDRGVFKIGMLHSPWNPELTLAITKPGFKPFEKRFYAKEHLESVVVTLEPASEAVKLQTPFSVSVVPGRSGITIAKNKPDEFFVVLTNIPGEPQADLGDMEQLGLSDNLIFKLATRQMAGSLLFLVSKKALQ